MIKAYKLFKWKNYAWAVYDDKRKHDSAYSQDLWYPSFYQFLEKYKKHSVIDIIISDEFIDNPNYILNKKETIGSYTSYNKYNISNKELIKLFNLIPQKIFIKTTNYFIEKLREELLINYNPDDYIEDLESAD